MSFFRTVVGLCADFRAYQQVCDRPFGQSVLYLLKLMALLSFILMATFLPVLWQASLQYSAWIDAHLPPVRIENGQVSTRVAQPYLAGSDQFRLILDTTGKITTIDTNAWQGILVHSNSFVAWHRITNSVVEPQTWEGSFAGFPDGEVTGAYVRHLMAWLFALGLPLGFVVATLLGMLIALIQAYLFAVVGTFLEQPSGNSLKLSQLLNLALHAVTPGAIIVTAYLAMQLEGLNLGLIYLIAFGIFLVGATNACREEEETPEN